MAFGSKPSPLQWRVLLRRVRAMRRYRRHMRLHNRANAKLLLLLSAPPKMDVRPRRPALGREPTGHLGI